MTNLLSRCIPYFLETFSDFPHRRVLLVHKHTEPQLRALYEHLVKDAIVQSRSLIVAKQKQEEENHANCKVQRAMEWLESDSISTVNNRSSSCCFSFDNFGLAAKMTTAKNQLKTFFYCYCCCCCCCCWHCYYCGYFCFYCAEGQHPVWG